MKPILSNNQYLYIQTYNLMQNRGRLTSRQLRRTSQKQKEVQMEHLLSQLLCKTRDCCILRKQSKFWFSSLLSFRFPHSSSLIKNDLTKQQYQQLLTNLNYLVCDLTAFYLKNPPDQVYNLLHIARTVFGIGIDSSIDLPNKSQIKGHTLIMYQLYFNNCLSLFVMRHKQYNYAIQCFEFILDVIKEERIDLSEQILLVSLSNYLGFIIRSQKSLATQTSKNEKIKELGDYLKNVYLGLTNKYIKYGVTLDCLMTLLAVYKQNIRLLGRFQAQNKLLIKKYQQANNIKQGIVYTDQNRIQKYIEQSRKKRIAQIQIKQNEISFLSTNSLGLDLRYRKFSNSVQLKKPNNMNNLNESQTLNKIQYKSIQRNSKGFEINELNQSKQLSSINRTINTAIKKLSTQKLELQKKKKHIKLYFKNQTVIFNVKNFSKISVMDSGVVISDYIQVKKRFLTWAQVFDITKLLRFSCIFSQYLPIVCFYDIARILSYYMQKPSNDDRWGAKVNNFPNVLTQINMLTKIYKTQGPYLKIFLMSQFDINHAQLSIDSYLQNIDDYFQKSIGSQYLQMLNKKIFNELNLEPYKINGLEFWRKNKKLSNEVLANKFNVKEILDNPFLKSSQFKIILFTPNQKDILLYLKQEDLKQQQQEKTAYLPITVAQLKIGGSRQYKLIVPLYKLSRYFPLQNFSGGMGLWLKKHGKFVIEGYPRCFQNFPESFNNFQYFSAITYAKKVQIVDQGRYKAPLIGELIGSKYRIWGITFRQFEQYSVKQVVTFIFNPYFQLLSPVIKLPQQERKNVFIDHLFEGSLAKTYKKLTETKLIGTMVNLIDYWNLIQF